MTTQLTWPVRLGNLAVVAVLLLDQSATAQGVTSLDYEGVTTLKEAVVMVKDRLQKDGKAEYAALLTEARVREAVATALKSYEAQLEEAEKRHPGSKEYFEEDVKPVYCQIADEGKWPPGCSFFSFYAITDRNGVSYDGLYLRLQVKTPQANFLGFSMPVADLCFGNFADSRE